MNLPRLILSFLLLGTTAQAATFFSDPVRGGPDGDGSSTRPWGSLESVLRNGRIQIRNPQGIPSNSDAPVKPGDTLLLRSGWHGILRIQTGFNERPITIAAAPGQTPEVAWIEIGGGKNWHLRGLTVSPSLAPTPIQKLPHHLVMLGEHGDAGSAGLVVEDCFIYSELDTTDWMAKDWVEKPSSGIWLGRHGKGHVARNNFILNTRFGISLCAPECLAEGNVVSRFSADGIRVTRDGQTVQDNVIKNVFVSARDGDPNHDDGIQAFLFNVGTGTLRDIILRRNIIISREKDNLPFPNGLQGIGCFDGPLVRFVVEQNVVAVNHFHGISLYDAQDCIIRDNVCFDRRSGRPQPWIMLGEKKDAASGNVVRNNFAHSFRFDADPNVRAENNQPVNDRIFRDRLERLTRLINDRFGSVHPTANRPRIESMNKE